MEKIAPYLHRYQNLAVYAVELAFLRQRYFHNVAYNLCVYRIAQQCHKGILCAKYGGLLVSILHT